MYEMMVSVLDFKISLEGCDGIQIICCSMLQTDKSGCASQTVNMTEFAINSGVYMDTFEVKAELAEFGTGRLNDWTLVLPQ